jgi:hypothetical protein
VLTKVGAHRDQRLRQLDQEEDRRARQTKGRTGLLLARRNRLKPGTHRLARIAAGVQPENHRAHRQSRQGHADDRQRVVEDEQQDDDGGAAPELDDACNQQTREAAREVLGDAEDKCEGNGEDEAIGGDGQGCAEPLQDAQPDLEQAHRHRYCCPLQRSAVMMPGGTAS